MERLNELLERALEAVRLEQTLRERAGQNGKVARSTRRAVLAS